MADFNFVEERIATGAAIDSSADVDQLIAAGITHCVDCRDVSDAPFLANRMAYLFNPTFDDGAPKPTSWFQATLDFCLPAMVQPKNKFYIHCAAGVNRGPSSAYCLLRALGISAVQAEDMIRTARPVVGLAYKKDAELALKVLGFTQ